MTAPPATGAPWTPPLPSILRRVFDALDAAGVEWCVLGGDRPVGDAANAIYLLLPSAGSPRVRRLFARHGFIPIRGSEPAHGSLIGYDATTDAWVTLNVVTDLRWGPYRCPKLPNGAESLRRRRSDDVSVLEDGEAFWMLLLDSLLDKSEISRAHRARLRDLAEHAVASDGLGAIVDRVASPHVTADTLLRGVHVGDWEALEATRPLLRSCFQISPSRHAAARWLNGTRATALGKRGLTVALVGPDGSGKTTLSATLRGAFPFAVETLYMGMHRDALASTRGDRPPSLPARLVAQWGRYARARSLSASGSMVIFDRYPIDATLPATRHAPAGRRAVRWLIGHSVPEPDLMIVLDAPAEVLVQRKHEQPVDVLARRRRQYLGLVERRPGTIVVDATADLQDLRRSVTRVIWEVCRRRSRSVRESPGPS